MHSGWQAGGYWQAAGLQRTRWMGIMNAVRGQRHVARHVSGCAHVTRACAGRAIELDTHFGTACVYVWRLW